MKVSSESSNSTSMSNQTDIENEFLEAMIGDNRPCLGSTSKLDYLVSVGSRSKASCSAAADSHFENSFHRLNEGVRPYQVYAELGHSQEELVGAPDANLDRHREYLQKRVLFLIALHLILLCLIDFAVQIALLNCGRSCPSPAVVFNVELGFVLLFPCLVPLFLRLVNFSRNSCFNFGLLSSYSVSFALFFFSVCDLLLGLSRAHRDISLILFTLTVSFVLFSLYVYSKNSTTCLYLSSAVLTLTVTATFSLLLAFPDVLNQLPLDMEGVFVPKLVPTKRTTIWTSYLVGLLFALASVALTTLIFTALRGLLFQSDSLSGTESVYATATRVLLRIEMFFLVYPGELAYRLSRRCLSASR